MNDIFSAKASKFAECKTLLIYLKLVDDLNLLW